MTATTGSICRSCNAPVEWRDGQNGKRVPVDVATGESHFKTCPDARQWSRQNGAQATPTSSSSTAKDRAIARMSALRSAAIYCGHRGSTDESVKSEHIFVMAERMLAWLEKGEN